MITDCHLLVQNPTDDVVGLQVDRKLLVTGNPVQKD